MQRLALGNYMPGVLVYCMSYFQVILFEDSRADRAVVASTCRDTIFPTFSGFPTFSEFPVHLTVTTCISPYHHLS